MTQPDTGLINKSWVVESYTNALIKTGVAVFSSQKFQVVSEAVFLNGFSAGTGTLTAIGAATVIAHGRSIPDQGTIAGTQAATLAPQQFMAAFYAGGQAGATIGGTVVTSAVFLVRGY